MPVREPLISSDPFYKWASGVKDTVSQQGLIRSPDFLGKSDQKGTHLKIHSKYKYNPTFMQMPVDWNPSSSYSPGQVVTVYDGFSTPLQQVQSDLTNFFGGNLSVATNPPGFPIESFPAGTVWQGTYRGATIYVPIYVPIPGTYVCVAAVPALNYAIDLKFAGLIQNTNISIGPNTSASDIENLRIVRALPVNYFPVWPDKSIYGPAVVDSENVLRVFGQYWQILSLLPEKKTACDSSGGITSTFTDTIQAPTAGSLNALDITIIPPK